jgi:hypothetical protein
LCVLLHAQQGGAVGSEEPGERAVELVAPHSSAYAAHPPYGSAAS